MPKVTFSPRGGNRYAVYVDGKRLGLVKKAAISSMRRQLKNEGRQPPPPLPKPERAKQPRLPTVIAYRDSGGVWCTCPNPKCGSEHSVTHSGEDECFYCKQRFIVKLPDKSTPIDIDDPMLVL